jgi:hypothetical protein
VCRKVKYILQKLIQKPINKLFQMIKSKSINKQNLSSALLLRSRALHLKPAKCTFEVEQGQQHGGRSEEPLVVVDEQHPDAGRVEGSASAGP